MCVWCVCGVCLVCVCFLCGEKDFVTAPFPVSIHCCSHILIPLSFFRFTFTSLVILSYLTGPSSTAASFAILSTNSFPSIPACPFTQPKCTFHFECASAIRLFLMSFISRFRLNLFCNKSKVIFPSVYIATLLSLSFPSCSFPNFSKSFKIAICFD